MSRIYDALIKAGKKPDSKPLLAQRRDDDRARSLRVAWQGVSLDRKIIGAVAGVLLISGLLLVVIVHQVLSRALHAQIDQNGLIVATNLSDAAAGYVAGKNVLELHALITKYARLDGVAYAFIEDPNGRVLAYSPGPIPGGLQSALTTDERKQFTRRIVNSGGGTVYEFRTPILEGQLGTAHLGLREEAVQTQIDRVRLPVIGVIGLLFLVSLIFALLLVRMIARPIAGPDGAESLESPLDSRAIG
jgi:sensor histidine kinase regulating citrate/malate metabolism